MSNSLSLCIVIPTKDRPKLLDEALLSIENQTELPEQIIIYDDGSQIRVELDLSMFPQIAELIEVVTVDPPQGAASAKSEGVRRSHCDLVAFLDDDDLYEPTFIEEIKRAFEEHRDDDIIFVGVGFFSNERVIDQSRYSDFLDKVIEDAGGTEMPSGFFSFSDSLLKALLLTGVPMAFQRPTLRRDIFESVSDYKNIPYWDVEWALQAAKSSARIGLLKKELYRQRVGSQQAYSDGNTLRHCQLDVEMKKLFLADLEKDHPLTSLAEHALAQSLLSLALVNRNEGLYFASLTRFIESQKIEFNPKSFKMLLGFFKVLFKS